MREALYALGAGAALLAVAVGWLLRDRTTRAPATERVAQAADELRQRQQDAAVTRAAAAIEARDQQADAARQRQEVAIRASETVDETLGRLGAAADGRVRHRQERGPGSGGGPG